MAGALVDGLGEVCQPGKVILDRQVELRLLGPLLAVAIGSDADLGELSRQQRRLLAALALRAGQAVSAERIADSLWGATPPATARAAIQVYVSGVRRALGRAIVRTVVDGYELAKETVSLDVDRFAMLAAQGRDELTVGRPEVAARLLEQALAMWRGTPYEDLDDDLEAVGERERLGELRLAAHESLAQAGLDAGAGAGLIASLRELAGRYPARERFAEQLMLALYRDGRQADALEVYQSARARLVDELGVEPGPGLRRMHARVLSQDESLHRAVSPGGRIAGLPVPPCPLLGRSGELAAVAEMLAEPGSPVVTITGPGGVGKTRLALEAAITATAGFAGGVTWVDLSASATSDDAVAAVAAALAVMVPADGDLESIAAALRRRNALLILDNTEQLTGFGAVLGRLARQVPALKVLATSRRAVRVSAERELRLAPLPVPGCGPGDGDGGEFSSVQLFTVMARRASHDVTLDESSGADAAAICRRLDGLPLAIVLATAQCRVLSVAQLREELESSLGALRSPDEDVAERQQTLASTIDWSVRLVGASAKDLFEKLGVFVGGATLAAVQAVAEDDVQAELTALVDHGLVQRNGDRFTMLTAAADYAAQGARRRPDWEALRERQARFFARGQEGYREDDAVRELAGRDIGNIRAARNWAAGHDPDGYIYLTSLIAQHLIGTAQLQLADDELTEALQLDLTDVHKARLLLLRQDARFRRGDHAGCVADVASAYALATRSGATWCIARCLHAMAWRAMLDGKLTEARELCGEGIELANRAGDAVLATRFINVLGATADAAGDQAQAIEYFLTYGRRARELGQYSDAAIASTSVAEIFLGRGHTTPAGERCAEARQLFTGLANPYFLTYLDDLEGQIDLAAGLATSAAAHFAAALELRLRHDLISEAANSLGGVACCLAMAGEPAKAWGLFAAVQRMSAEKPVIAAMAPEARLHRDTMDRLCVGMSAAERGLAAVSYADLPLAELMRVGVSLGLKAGEVAR